VAEDAQPSAGAREITVRIADERDVDALARLRRAWSEERRGRPVEDPSFEARWNFTCATQLPNTSCDHVTLCGSGMTKSEALSNL